MPHDAPAAASAPPAYGGALSRREREVLGLLAMGASGPEIAERLFISPATVRTHIGNAITKLGAKTRTQAIALALQQRAITLEPDVPAGPPPAEAT
ncbi:MAG: helix-turn-helix transcriptional regulator [Actinomycetota bacterium]|nr:helix-turn-helix transcriptional regulator [Actinomycetota bacterium]